MEKDEYLSEEEKEKEKKSPFFNFADASLERIHVILKQIAVVSIDERFPDYIKQSKKLALVKTLLFYAIPLNPKGFTDEFQKEILSLQPSRNTKFFVKNRIQRKNNFIFFDWKLDEKLDKFIIDISLKLQSKGYFMPSKKKSLF